LVRSLKGSVIGREKTTEPDATEIMMEEEKHKHG
jgi:hypothetical protein